MRPSGNEAGEVYTVRRMSRKRNVEVIESRNAYYWECRRFSGGGRQKRYFCNGMEVADSPGPESMARPEGIAMNVGYPHYSPWIGVSPDKSKQRGRRDGGVGVGEATYCQ